LLTAALLLAACGNANADPAPRRVYVVHSGVHIFFAHPDKNHAALVFRDELRRRDVPDRDIVVLECPYPEASWQNLVPRDGVVMFLEAMSPRSKVSHEAYRRLHRALQSQGVGSKDDIVWIGHSAGGQVGMTMAHLAAHVDKHPELAKNTKPYRFHTIVTLGTPVGCNEVPDGVRVRHYFSPQDKIVRIVCDLGPWILPRLGYSCKIRPCTHAPGKNCLTRLWHGVEHPDWLYERRVFDQMWQDINGKGTAWYREPRAASGPGVALTSLLCLMLEEEQRICIEDF
jgi:hypothetical protein